MSHRSFEIYGQTPLYYIFTAIVLVGDGEDGRSWEPQYKGLTWRCRIPQREMMQLNVIARAHHRVLPYCVSRDIAAPMRATTVLRRFSFLLDDISVNKKKTAPYSLLLSDADLPRDWLSITSTVAASAFAAYRNVASFLSLRWSLFRAKHWDACSMPSLTKISNQSYKSAWRRNVRKRFQRWLYPYYYGWDRYSRFALYSAKLYTPFLPLRFVSPHKAKELPVAGP